MQIARGELQGLRRGPPCQQHFASQREDRDIGDVSGQPDLGTQFG